MCLDQLEPDSVYLYTIELGPIPAMGNIPIAEADFTEQVFPRALPVTVRNTQRTMLKEISLRTPSVPPTDDQWLFFRTMPSQWDSFRFAHGSCRKWPGDVGAAGKAPGPDMLEKFGSDWLAKRNWSEWPRFLLHTGDQIYADDVGTRQGEILLGGRFAAIPAGPPPTVANDIAYGAWSGRFGFRYSPLEKSGAAPSADDIDPQYLRGFFDFKGRDWWLINQIFDKAVDVRKQLASHQRFADRTRPVRFKLRVQNHLLWKIPYAERGIPVFDKRLGLRTREGYLVKHRNRAYRVEYPSAGETDPFAGEQRNPGGVHAADYAEYSALYEQAWSTPHARRGLAHVPSFMIFDDHEVTDDWNASPGWMKLVHSKSDPLQHWPMTMTDALASYWVYQGWGNLAPDDWKSDPRVRILEQCRRTGRDALPELRRLIFDRAIRPTAPGADRSRKLSWNYSLPTGAVPFLVVDLRTDRDVNGKGGLSPERLQWLERSLLQSSSPVAFIVLPVPFLMPDPMLFAVRNAGFVGWWAGARTTDEFKRDSDIEHPAGNLVWDQIKNIVIQLQRKSSLKTVVFVSGDIHFSCNLDGRLTDSSRTPRLLQLVSSGLQQTISTDKQKQLASAYGGKLNIVSGSTGADTHRGVRITVGGLWGPNGVLENFLYHTSIALVDVKLVSSSKTRVPLIVQTHLTSGERGAMPQYGFLHMTQPTGRAVMTLKDPGFKTPVGWPAEYPRGEGTGLVQEVEEEVAEYSALDDTIQTLDPVPDSTEELQPDEETFRDDAGEFSEVYGAFEAEVELAPNDDDLDGEYQASDET